MKKRGTYSSVRLFLSIILVAIFTQFVHIPAYATEADMPEVKVAISDDQSIILHRILYEALNRTGHQMVAQVTGMRTAVADVNYGDAAILPLQTDGWEERYENLVKVPVVIDYVEFTAYTRVGEEYDFSEWGDLAGLRLGYRWQNEYVANNAPRANASELVPVNTIGELWATLLEDETDVVVLPRIAHFEHRHPPGIKKESVIERQPCYSYVNSNYEYLVPLLEKAYTEMIADGTMDLLKSGLNQSDDKKIVIYINSFSAQNELERNQMEAIRRNLEIDSEVELYSFYLNSNESHSKASFNSVISDMIRTDFVARFPDLIISSGNDALEFVLNNYYLLFPKVPFQFFGVIETDEAMFLGHDEHMTGVYETLSFHETASEILRLYPYTDKIYILNDHVLTRSIKIREEIERSLEKDPLPVEIEFNDNKPFSEILSDIRNLNTDTMVLIGSYLSDSNRIFYTETEIQESVSEAAENPVFCLTAPYIGQGTLGGLVSSTDEQSILVASRAAELLMRAPPAEIPVITDSSDLNQWQFDHLTADKFGIDTRVLPADHVIINRVIPIWESNPLEFRLAIVAGALLLAIICVLIIFSRVVARKQVAAEAASATKSIFLANMSHEIRTPLNAIIGMTSIGMSVPEEDRMKDCFTKIEDASKHLLGVIDDILDMSKIEAGKVELTRAAFNMDKMLSRIMAVFNLRIGEKNQTFNIDLDTEIPKTLIGDEHRLAQVIANILSNAVKFTPENGSIGLEAKLIEEISGICTIQFTVADSGIGITQEQKTRMFQSFYQAEDGNTRKFGGTGLGLPISKSIVEMMGGKIWFESEPGEGSSFFFTVVLERGTEEEEMLPPEEIREKEADDFSQYCILIAEDVDINRDIVMALLEPTGLEIECAENGEEAFDMFMANPEKYSMIFMDLQMPVMDGYEATRRIREAGISKANEIPIIAMTANVFKEDIEKCLEAGMNGHIGKPIDVNEVLRHLRIIFSENDFRE